MSAVAADDPAHDQAQAEAFMGRIAEILDAGALGNMAVYAQHVSLMGKVEETGE